MAARPAATPPALRPTVPVFAPDDSSLRPALQAPGVTLVACLCAQWCGTCREYQPKFAALAERWRSHVFVWIDIEDDPEYAGDDDIENFPTLLVQSPAGVAFYGPMLPHIGHLEKLLEALAAEPGSLQAAGPNLLALLRQG